MMQRWRDRTLAIVLGLAVTGMLVTPSMTEGVPRSKKKQAGRRQPARRQPAPVDVGVPSPDGTINIRAKAALVVNLQSGEVLYQKNPTAQLPIASLTKLMTVITFLNMNPDLNKTVTIIREDVRGARWTQLRTGETVTVRDLLYAALVSSDNAAARAIARTSGLPRGEFITRMNQMASGLGLMNSAFADPTGLDPGNVSTVVDCAALLWNASKNDIIAKIMPTPEYRFSTNRRQHQLITTNRLLRSPEASMWEILGGKTGYIRQSGYCLVTLARNRLGEGVVAVVLGGVSSASRFADMRRLLFWGLQTPEQKVGG